MSARLGVGDIGLGAWDEVHVQAWQSLPPPARVSGDDALRALELTIIDSSSVGREVRLD